MNSLKIDDRVPERIKAEIEDCEKQIKKARENVAEASEMSTPQPATIENQMARANYLSGYRDALVRILVDNNWH